MLDSTKAIIKLADIGTTCKELQAVCIGCENTDLEQYKYYRSMLELLYPQYQFLLSEADILHNLQKEVWAMEEVERNKNIDELFQQIAVYESKKSNQIIEVEVTEKEYKTPFEKVLDFNILGYNIFFCLEIGKNT
ncbi:hypothetical protein ACE193_01350 [Bernardetia sp. OM2101]|uniref:hypothetical protein n=1 Tax=Bernardetia sp. OM2101 TaxID=3344876 RepID=UPI0035D07067